MDVLLLCLRHELQLLLGLELQVGDGDWKQQTKDYLKEQYYLDLSRFTNKQNLAEFH